MVAQRDGHKVVAVQGHPLGVGDISGLDLDGYMADQLERVLSTAGRLIDG